MKPEPDVKFVNQRPTNTLSIVITVFANAG